MLVSQFINESLSLDLTAFFTKFREEEIQKLISVTTMASRDQPVVLVGRKCANTVGLVHNDASRISDAVNEVMGTRDLHSLEDFRITGKRPQGMADGGTSFLDFSELADEIQQWTLIRLTHFGVFLIVEAVHAVTSNEDEAYIVIDVHFVDILVHTDGVMALVAVELKVLLAPQS